MKYVKRIFALFLSIVLLPPASFVIAEETVASSLENEVEVLSTVEFDALNTMGMLGEDFFTLSADAPVSRAQFVGSLYRIAGYEKIFHGIEDIPFIDVSIDMPYKDEICALYKMGIIKGTASHTFSPNESITYNQAVKLIVAVCGYENLTQVKYGNDMRAYVAMANFLKLSTGMKIQDVSAPLAAGNAVQLLYNAARTKVMEASAFTENGSVYYESDDSEELISKNNKIYYNEGLMQSNGIVSLITAEADEGLATIGDTEYFIGGLDLSEYIGCSVKFFYKDDAGIKTLVWVGEGKRNEVLELKSDDLEVDNNNYSMQNIVYRKNNRITEVKISPYAVIVYNNALYNDAELKHLKPAMGIIKLIDNDKDKIYDTVIVEEYRNIFLTSNITPLGYLGDKYGPAIDLSDYDSVKIYKGGVEVSPEDIEINSLISVVADDRNKKSILLYVSEEYGQGVLSKSSKTDGNVLYEFEGKEYEVAPSYENRNANYIKIDPVLGAKYKYYLDKSGKIAEIEEFADGVLDYALLVDAVENDEAFAEENSAALKLVLKNGDITWAYTRKRVKIDGVKNQTGADILAMDLYDENGQFVEQVVKVAFDSEGKVKEIEFATENTTHPYGYDASNFTLDYSGTGSIVSRNGQLRFEKYILDSSVKVFIKYVDLEDDNPYTVVSGSSLGQGSRNMKLYDINADQSITVGYTTRSLKSSLASEMLVSDVFYKKVDDEFAKCIGGYYGGTYMEYAEFNEGVIPGDIKRGDVVDLSIYNQRLVGVTKFVSLAEKPNPVADGTFLSNDFRILSYIYTASNSMLTMLAPDGFAAEYGKVLPMALEKIYAIPVMVYDVKNDAMYKGTAGDLCSTTAPQIDGSLPIDENTVMALIQSSNQKIIDVILVKY